MEKINFVNGTTINGAETFNQMQTNIENAFSPVVLFENANGSNSTITLNDTLANYSYVEIYFREGNGYYNYTKVFSPNGKNISLSVLVPNSTYSRTYVKSSLANLSGTSITFSESSEGSILENGASWVSLPNNRMYIAKVVGYK